LLTGSAPNDPDAPFLLAFIRSGTHGAADLAVYSLLRRGIARFSDGTLTVLQPNASVPTLAERCALQWAIAAHNTRPNEHLYVRHPAFAPLNTLNAMLRERRLAGDLRVPRTARACTHAVGALALVVGVSLAIYLKSAGASNKVLSITLASGVIQCLVFCMMAARKTSQLPLLLPLMRAMHGSRMAATLAVKALPLQDVLWVGGLYKFVLVASSSSRLRDACRIFAKLLPKPGPR
jgi:uncharacterized protein (TIGR04222 family)